MGKRGPQRTPTAKLALRGSWRAGQRKEDGEPASEGGRPKCPAWLPDEAKLCHRRLIPKLEKMGVLGVIDGEAVARYCLLYARWRQAEEFVNQFGLVQTIQHKDENGKVKEIEMKEWPQVARASRLCDQLFKLEQVFGMSPSARASLLPSDWQASKSNGQNKNKEEGKDKSRFFNPRLVGDGPTAG